VNTLIAKSVPLLSPPNDSLGGELRAAWICDSDGNPIQLVQQKR
jgi:hypothetical protein